MAGIQQENTCCTVGCAEIRGEMKGRGWEVGEEAGGQEAQRGGYGREKMKTVCKRAGWAFVVQ